MRRSEWMGRRSGASTDSPGSTPQNAESERISGRVLPRLEVSPRLDVRQHSGLLAHSLRELVSRGDLNRSSFGDRLVVQCGSYSEIG
jgi:hypothetical protein